MLQGNYKQNIFFEDSDYIKFCKLLEKSTNQYNCKIHLFCLMTNHIHFVIEISRIPLWKIMQSICSSYTRFINKKLDKNGHLFRGRFLDKVVHDEPYLRELCMYIHRNPLAARMVYSLDEYPWSSHHSYMHGSKFEWVTTDLINTALSTQITSQNNYHDFMNDRENSYNKPKYCTFDDNECLTITCPEALIPQSQKEINLDILSINEIINIICEKTGVSVTNIKSDSRRDEIITARTLVTFFAYYYGKKLLVDIAYHLERPADGLSRTLHRHMTSENKKCRLEPVIKKIEREFWQIIKDKENIANNDSQIIIHNH